MVPAKLTGNLSRCVSTLFLYLIFCSPLIGQDRQLIMSSPQYYFDREPLFADVDFDIGETKVITSPHSDTFISLLVPTYEGLPKLGPPNEYYANHPRKRNEIYQTRQERMAVTERLKNNIGIYLSLMALDLVKEEITTENLMFYDAQAYGNKYYLAYQSIDNKVRATIIPRNHIEGLSGGLLTKEAYKQYFCGEAPNCSEGYKQRNIKNWGAAGNNEFKKRAAYQKYVETEVPKLKSWAANLGRQVAIVSIIVLPTYDFSKGGYEINLFPGKLSGSASSNDLMFWPREGQPEYFKNYGSEPQNLLLAIPPDQAEQLSEKLKAESGSSNQMLYAVVKGEIWRLGPNVRNGAPLTSYGSNLGYLYDIIDPRITFYSDQALTDKVYETNLKAP